MEFSKWSATTYDNGLKKIESSLLEDSIVEIFVKKSS